MAMTPRTLPLVSTTGSETKVARSAGRRSDAEIIAPHALDRFGEIGPERIILAEKGGDWLKLEDARTRPSDIHEIDGLQLRFLGKPLQARFSLMISEPFRVSLVSGSCARTKGKY
jgi:hypothetical protein